MRYARRTGVLGLAVAGLALAGVSPAHAVPEEAIASGSVGSVDATYDDAAVEVDPLAECATDGENAADSAAYEEDGFLEFGRGSSTCTLGDDGVASAETEGKLFRLDALRPYGGPRIRMTNYSAECSTTENGSTASFHIGGLSGISVPASLPPNYEVTIPGPGPGAPALATVTFNESIVPDPPDGSMTVNIMHIHLSPDGPANGMDGEIVVGSVSCSPF
ncbi:MAG TPA: choice-of-anchor P family protein [Actinophytocola sp.]|nr:choice-of-anchor P family protein [Actinophytocola sp.]